MVCLQRKNNMEQTITVSQLAWYIKKIFEAEELLYNVSVVGEVSGLKIVRGIAYFDLKDETSLISCVCFYGGALDGVKNGDKIVAKGTPGFYVKGGKLNFNVSKITPFGVGDLFRAFLELKDKLEKEGIFDDACKKDLPDNVTTIGVITSETGAVIHDIITVATRRNPGINIVLYPAKVQGQGTSESVINGLEYFETRDDVQVVIIARGGGSAEDLWEFNSEALARKIFDCTKPIISAIGHETDFTICDFAADIRAATPSAAAELVAEEIKSKKWLLQGQISVLQSRISSIILDNEAHFENQLSALTGAIEDKIQNMQHALEIQKTTLEKYNPNHILGLGYAKVSVNGGAVVSAKSLAAGDKITIDFKDGTLKGEIL